MKIKKIIDKNEANHHLVSQSQQLDVFLLVNVLDSYYGFESSFDVYVYFS